MESVTVGVLVPAKHIAKVIGKSGAGLRQIREATGCKLQVQQKADEEQEQESESRTRRVDISGSIAQIIAAFQLLLFKAFPEEQSLPSLMIPSNKAGQVVGRGGENLKKVREMCHVRITLEREPVVDPATGLEERLLTLQGDLIQMPAALRFVFGVAIGPAMSPSAGCGAMALPMAMGPYGGDLHGFGTGVRPAGTDPAEIQVHFSVPERLAGAILGKGGALVKQTAAAAGCRLSMTSRDAGGERRAVIIGAFDQCVAAQGMLRQQIEEAAGATEVDLSQVAVVFMIRREAAGAVIGKAGAGMQKIREQSGAKIHLAREEVEGQRPCTIAGSFEAVMAAEKSIYELVREVPVELHATSRGMGWGGGCGGFHEGMKQLDDESTTKLLVPTQCAGAVIGKQGARLKEIRETTGAHVEMMTPNSAPQWPTDRMVILRGDAFQREAAAQAVLRASFPNLAETCTLKMLVSSSQAGGVIGKQGGTLKRVREQSGIGVQVDREEVCGERLISATGPLNQVVAALHLLCTVLANPNEPLPEVPVQPQASRALAPSPAQQQAMAASYMPYLAPQPHLLPGQFAQQAFPPNMTWPGY